jgi:hypothetical protein
MMDSLPAHDGRPLWLRLLLVVLPLAGGVPLLLARTGFVGQTIGVALIGIAIYGLWPQLLLLARQRLGDSEQSRLLRWLPVIAIVGVAAALLAPALLGMMPQSQDHPVHLTRAWHFVSEMLAKGRLSGWSDLWFAGWPAGEDYPPGADYWIASLYLITFGALGWETTYGLAFLAMFAFAGVSVYAFGRTYFGRGAGLIAALFLLLDRGQYREGGWSYTVWWGVWPQILATAFVFLSLAALDRVIVRARARDFALGAFLVGMAVLSHPVAVIYYGLAVPIYFIARCLGREQPAGQVLARGIAVFVLGALLAAFWILPFSAKGAWMAKYGDLWQSLAAMADGLWKGTLFENVTPPLVWLGVIGGVLAAWRRSSAGIFLAIYAALTLFISSSTAFQELNLLGLSPSFGQVQFQRLAIPAKVCLFLLAGYSLQQLFTGNSTASAESARFNWKRYGLACLLILVASPFVVPLGRVWGKTYGGDLGRPKTRKDIPQWHDYQAFLRWSKELRQNEKEFYRMAYVRPYNDHFFAAAPVFNQTPAYKVGFTPCTNFIHKPDTADAELYRVLSVKYVVSLGQPGGRDLELVQRFGQIFVHRFKGYQPTRFTLEGGGEAEVLQFDPERIRLKVKNAASGSRLILHVANYPNWRATQDGERLEIETGSLGKHNIFISVPARDGTIEFTYGWPAINAIGATLSWIALAFLALFGVCRYRPHLAEQLKRRFSPWAERAQRHGVVLTCALLVIGPGGLFLSKKLAGKGQQGDTQLERSLVDRLESASVWIERNGAKEACRWQRGRWQCSDRSWNYVGPVSYRLDDQFRRCAWAHPVEGAKLIIEFSNVQLKRAVVGYHGVLDQAVQGFPGGAPVTLAIEVGDQLRQQFSSPNRKGWNRWSVDTAALIGKAGKVRLTISTDRAAGRHYCFDLAVER